MLLICEFSDRLLKLTSIAKHMQVSEAIRLDGDFYTEIFKNKAHFPAELLIAGITTKR